MTRIIGDTRIAIGIADSAEGVGVAFALKNAALPDGGIEFFLPADHAMAFADRVTEAALTAHEDGGCVDCACEPAKGPAQ
jgi:hypothetical protein